VVHVILYGNQTSLTITGHVFFPPTVVGMARRNNLLRVARGENFKPNSSAGRAALFRQATKGMVANQPSRQQIRARQRAVKVVPFINLAAMTTNVISKALLTARTPAAAARAVANTPVPAQVATVVAAKANIPVVVAKAMDPSVLANAILQAVQSGVKQIPPKIAAPAISAPTPQATAVKVAKMLDVTTLAQAVVEAIRMGIKPVPAAIRTQKPDVLVPAVQEVIPNSGKVAEGVVRAVSNALRVPVKAPSFSFSAPSFRLPSFTAPSFRLPSGLRFPTLRRGAAAPPLPENGGPPPPLPGARRQGPFVVTNPNGLIGLAVPQSQANASAAAAAEAAQRARNSANAAHQRATTANAASQADPNNEQKKQEAKKTTEAASTATNAANTANTAAQTAAKAASNVNPQNSKKAVNEAIKAANTANTAAQTAAKAASNVNPQNSKKAASAAVGAVTTSGGAGGSSTITFSPNIKIQLDGLPRAANAARNNTTKLVNLMKLVNNLKAKLPNGSQTKNTIVNLFKNQNKIPTGEQVKKALVRSLTNMNINELLAYRKTATNKSRVNLALREKVSDEVRRIQRLSSSERTWRLTALYKSLPESFSGRANVERAIISELRESGRHRDPLEARRRLNNFRRNFGSSLPKRLSTEFNIQTRRAKLNQARYGQGYGTTLRNDKKYSPMRSNGSGGLILRQNTYGSVKPERKMLQQGPLRQGNSGGMTLGNGGRPMKEEGPLPQNVLPPVQAGAINRAGGPVTALHAIAAVPGGAPQVALAAQALNEANGNRTKAVAQGADPVAVNAVQKLGGHTNAGYVLEGLNTLAQKPRARGVGRSRKSKPTGIRLNELNRVINAVKKRKLVSLVAHNVTKTGIHNNENRSKKYYKKVIKSNILRRPLAAKVRNAAKKAKAKK
jgi:hypothetical protein